VSAGTPAGSPLTLDPVGDAGRRVDDVEHAPADRQQVAAGQHADPVEPEAGRLDVVARDGEDPAAARLPAGWAPRPRSTTRIWLVLESVT
jgi:hypothetical protein